MLESGADPTKPLEDQLEDLIQFAERQRVAIDELRPKCERIDIFCGIFSGDDDQGGFSLESKLMGRMADLGLDLTFDIY